MCFLVIVFIWLRQTHFIRLFLGQTFFGWHLLSPVQRIPNKLMQDHLAYSDPILGTSRGPLCPLLTSFFASHERWWVLLFFVFGILCFKRGGLDKMIDHTMFKLSLSQFLVCVIIHYWVMSVKDSNECSGFIRLVRCQFYPHVFWCRLSGVHMFKIVIFGEYLCILF